MAEPVSHSGPSLGDWIKDRFAAFPSSGKINLRVEDAGQAIDNVLQIYRKDAIIYR